MEPKPPIKEIAKRVALALVCGYVILATAFGTMDFIGEYIASKRVARYKGNVAPTAIYFTQAPHEIATDRGPWHLYNTDVNGDGTVESVLDIGDLEYLIERYDGEISLRRFAILNGEIRYLSNSLDD